jgi:hypothetical protein
MTTEATPATSVLPDYAPLPETARGPALNDQGYYVGRVERNLYFVTDGTYMCAFLTTSDGVVVLDAPPTLGNNIQRAIDEIAAANGVTNRVEYLVYSHHHSDHVGAASLFDKNVTRIGHEETRKLLLRDNDPARPPNEETFQDQDSRSAASGSNRFTAPTTRRQHPDPPAKPARGTHRHHNQGWVPIYRSNLSRASRLPQHPAARYVSVNFIGGHMGRLARTAPALHQRYMSNISDARNAIDTVDRRPTSREVRRELLGGAQGYLDECRRDGHARDQKYGVLAAAGMRRTPSFEVIQSIPSFRRPVHP